MKDKVLLDILLIEVFSLFIRKVRHGVLFAISMVILSVPGHILLTDLQSEVMETKHWLEGTFVELIEILEYFSYTLSLPKRGILIKCVCINTT